MNTLAFANAETPIVGAEWLKLTETERVTLIKQNLSIKGGALKSSVSIVDAKDDGQVIVSILEQSSSDKRGTLLLDLESFLKESIDFGLVVWLEPLGDRNSMRNLRGIEVKV